MDVKGEGSGKPEGVPIVLEGITNPLARRVVASFTDLAMIVNGDGEILEVSAGPGLESRAGWAELQGHNWVDVLVSDSQPKVDQLLSEAADGHTLRPREMNLRVNGVGMVPFRFTGALLDDDQFVVLGVDIRPVADLQQRMVGAQQRMELEYDRLRQSEAQYRILFHVTPEAVLFASGEQNTVSEVNPAAAALLGATTDALRGTPLAELLSDRSTDDLALLLESARNGKQAEGRLIVRGADPMEVHAAAVSYRRSGSMSVLLRLWPVDTGAPSSARTSRVLAVIDTMPDAFVVVGEDLRVLSANASFCEMVEAGTEDELVGQSVDQWLGRPRVDLSIIKTNLREHGLIRNFASIVRGQFGAQRSVSVTAVAALDATPPCYGFVLRPVSSGADAPSSRPFQARSAEQLQELVGRVSLKEIVQESSDLIERLCIEAALELSGNNRAAAAQLLGLSRQSLYSKLRRHKLEEFQPS